MNTDKSGQAVSGGMTVDENTELSLQYKPKGCWKWKRWNEQMKLEQSWLLIP